MVPQPSRIRLFAPTDRHKKRPVGHWFLRADLNADPAEERWKLSLWYPQCEIWGPGRRRLDGRGWQQASEAFADSFHQIAEDRHQAFEVNDRRLTQMLEGGMAMGPGYRPQYTKKLRTQQRNEWARFKHWLVASAAEYQQFITENGWPPAAARSWIWEV